MVIDAMNNAVELLKPEPNISELTVLDDLDSLPTSESVRLLVASDPGKTPSWGVYARYCLRIFARHLRSYERRRDGENEECRDSIVHDVELDDCPMCGARAVMIHRTLPYSLISLPGMSGHYFVRCSNGRVYDGDAQCPLSDSSSPSRPTKREAANLWNSWASVRESREDARERRRKKVRAEGEAAT